MIYIYQENSEECVEWSKQMNNGQSFVIVRNECKSCGFNTDISDLISCKTLPQSDSFTEIYIPNYKFQRISIEYQFNLSKVLSIIV